MFNAINHVNYSNPSTTITNTARVDLAVGLDADDAGVDEAKLVVEYDE